jgi:hypothetical protein
LKLSELTDTVNTVHNRKTSQPHKISRSQKVGSVLYLKFAPLKKGQWAVTGKSGQIASVRVRGGRWTISPTKDRYSFEEWHSNMTFMLTNTP